MYTIAEVVPMVVDKLRGRGDLSTYDGAIGSDIPSWIYHAINDLTPNFPFMELSIPGPLFQFVVGQNYYPINYFLAENGPPFTMVNSFHRYFTSTPPPYLGQVGGPIKCRSLAVVRPMSDIPGIPTYWAQVGDNILFGFNPDQGYYGQMYYQRKHPFVIANLPACPVTCLRIGKKYSLTLPRLKVATI